MDEAAAAHLGINRTDLRCLGVLLEQGPLPASKLAEAVALTRGAMTTALDRIEQAGFIRRIRNDQDRRGVTIEATQTAKDAIKSIWAPIRADGLAVLRKYSDADLELLCRFFEDYCEIQRTHAARIRGSEEA
ncbi:MAG TPA: MarR family transcriptional regulator [Steroidobacteraceae bacterium]|nr:MarR family transcriptional regulator [Steroidobacteraceae bacterium]